MSKMNDANQSNVAIKFKESEEIIFELEQDSVNEVNDQINPNVTPVITENVPFKNQPKDISKWYIGINISLNICFLTLILVLSLSRSQLGRAFIIAITVSLYLVYLVVAYHSSNLMPLTGLQSVHEYKSIFKELTEAKCSLKFKYVSSRNSIDQSAKTHQKEYDHIQVKDRSGVLYNVERTYQVIFVQYNKKFFYCDNSFKAKIYEEFGAFVDKCKKEYEVNQRRSLLRGKEKIELLIENMRKEMGFYVNEEDNNYKCIFILTLLSGMGVYYEFFMRKRVLRYEMDIVKEIFPEN